MQIINVVTSQRRFEKDRLPINLYVRLLFNYIPILKIQATHKRRQQRRF
jgi:hypothetical protein